MLLRRPFLLSFLCIFGLSVNAQCPSYPLQHNYAPDLVLAARWDSILVSNNLTFPRGMLFDSEGNLLLVDRGIGVVGWKVMEREDGGACLEDKKVVVENDQFNHGIALSEDGTTLYVSTKNDVFSYPYDSKTRTTTSPNSKSLITNMSNTGHVTRTLYIHSGTILISAGSEGNLDPLATKPNSGHSVVKFFSLKEAHARKKAFDFKTEGGLLGWGLRNSVGLTVDPMTGGVWAVENSVDMLSRGGKEIYQDNPGEELNFLGWWNQTIDNPGYIGPNYGYPSCVAVWDVPSLPDNGGITVGEQIVVDQLSTRNATTDADCNDEKKFASPRLTFQAHMAPLDVHFDYFPSGGDGGLWVSFHGSWNRDVPTGYKLSKIPFDKATGQPMAKATDKQNYEDVLWNRDTMKCKDNGCFRPVGVAIDGKGRVWVGSDSSGEVMVLWTTGDRKGGPEGTDNVDNGNNRNSENNGNTSVSGESSAVIGSSWNEKIGVAGLVAGVLGVMML
ncbi:hypothetical protein EV426DRAFT_624635 [Tirmania nivea]|nr:hypothetical protein EV426DRAFT_624635 [Tirmania nivea]